MLESRNFHPPPDLAPFVRQLFVFRAALPEDFTLIDTLVSESAMVRVLLAGDWAAHFGHGDWRSEGPCLLFGANSRGVRVRVRGAFIVVGFSIRSSGWQALFREKASDFADDMIALEEVWGDPVTTLHSELDTCRDHDDAMIALIVSMLRRRLAAVGSYKYDREMTVLEDIAHTDSTMRVGEVGERLFLSPKALERRCCATFGMTPKAVLRRSRFLDMAAAVRGISDPDEEERAALRFSDQSHMNREFRHFVGMTPGQFEKAQTPLLNAVLKLRADGLS
jgi:AraC-like DNA-binding protein